jgi:hypothetical protein
VILSETGKGDKFYLQPQIAYLVKIRSAVFELLTLVQNNGRTDGRTDSAVLIGALRDEKMPNYRKQARRKE